MNKQIFGKFGESVATEYLKGLGYSILSRNFRGKAGEIDIIAKKDGLLLFIEVKSRRSLSFGIPSQAVNREKQKHIYAVAAEYLATHNVYYKERRNEVVEVYINHIENAF
ncbi:MAG: YraN family protein [Anaerovoracaceae bacterium]